MNCRSRRDVCRPVLLPKLLIEHPVVCEIPPVNQTVRRAFLFKTDYSASFYEVQFVVLAPSLLTTFSTSSFKATVYRESTKALSPWEG